MLLAFSVGAQEKPDELVKKVTDDVMAAIQSDKQLAAGDKQKALRLAEEKIIPHVDFEEARKSRKRVLDQVASDRLLVAGMHLHFPGFYHVARQGDGYFLHAEAWQHAL